MPTPPLHGPHGLYTVSDMPRFLLDSSRVGWTGAYFTDLMAVPQGQVDHVHQRICVRRSLQLEARRRPAAAHWEPMPAGVSVKHTGEEERFQWRNGGRAQFLFIADEHATAVLGRPLEPAPGHGRSRLDPAQAHGPALIMDALMADLAQGSPAGPLVGDSLIVALLGQLAGAARQPVPAALGARSCARATELIDARFAEPLTLGELAAASGLSVRQFTRAFREATGRSPHQYLLQRRIEHAQRQIAQGCPLAEVALQCGFADQSQLTRVFVRHLGVTPGRYRPPRRG